MGIFDKFKTSTAIDRLSEERLYEQVAQELKAGKKRDGIWVKAMAKTGGDLNKAEALYIELRVQAIKDEASLASAQQKLNEEIRKSQELEREAELSRKKEIYINKLENLGYEVVLYPDSESAFKVVNLATDVSHSFDTLEELYQFSNSIPQSIPGDVMGRVWLFTIKMIAILVILYLIV